MFSPYGIFQVKATGQASTGDLDIGLLPVGAEAYVVWKPIVAVAGLANEENGLNSPASFAYADDSIRSLGGAVDH